MIFERSLQRELTYTATAVFTVLLTIMLTTMMIRIVGFAATGEVDPRDVLVLIALQVIGYLAVILIVTLFVSILFVLTRWYRDSEMVVWLSSGLSLTRFIRPIAMFSTPIVLMIAVCAFVAWPWSNQQSKFLRDRFQQRDDVSLLAPGQFRESAINHRVFFVEKMSPNLKHVENVFVTSTENDKVSVTVSSQGHVEIEPNGDRFIVLENGRRYDGTPGALDYHVMEFLRYGVKLENQRLISIPTASTMSTMDLIRHPTPLDLGELAWRIGLPLIAINLFLLAIPLAYQNPRRNRAINLVFAVLIYLTYSTLLNVAQSWIVQKKISFVLGLSFLHVIVAIVVVALFWLRVRNRPLLSGGLFQRLGKKGA